MWIKICGIRDVETARIVSDFGADAIGLNFYAPSPRCVDEAVAERIVDALPAGVTPVGLFVNHSTSRIREICERCHLTTVQLHGDEPASQLSDLKELRVIRALRIAQSVADDTAAELAAYAISGVSPWAWLVDAKVPHVYGGSGETVDWEALAAAGRPEVWPPLILAGGLTPENIAVAIQTVGPWGVDVASGVESVPGVKDLTLVERFIAQVRAAS